MSSFIVSNYTSQVWKVDNSLHKSTTKRSPPPEESEVIISNIFIEFILVNNGMLFLSILIDADIFCYNILPRLFSMKILFFDIILHLFF